MTGMVEKTSAHVARVLACITGTWLVMTAALHAQSYTLQSGDVLQAEITRLGNARWSSMVDANGFVRFPYIGRHFARGKSLEELEEDIVLSVVGRRISVMDGSRETVVVLNESSVFLDVAEYRPVTVIGAVAQPGSVTYRPGLTVRAVLGVAGGIRLILEEEVRRPDRTYLVTTRVNELQRTEAWLMMDLWRIRGQLDPEFAETPPAEFVETLEARLEPEHFDDTRQRIQEALRDQSLEKDDLRDRIKLTNERISFLTRALDQYEVVSEAEEERLANLLTLQDRGLTVTNNVNSARAGALSASSRLLQTEADLAEASRELSALNRQINTVETDARQDLLSEQARVLRSLDEVRARLEGARQEMIILTGQPVDVVDSTPLVPRLVIHRQQGETIVSMSAEPNDIVFPGDVLEVLLGDSLLPE